MTPLNDFLDGPKMIGGIEFRPFTFGSKALCEQLELSIFISGTTPDDPEEIDRQMIAFTWIHSAPLNDVLRAVREKRAKEAAWEFGFRIPMSALGDIVAEINRVSKQAAQNAVDVEQKPGATADQPGNSCGQTG